MSFEQADFGHHTRFDNRMLGSVGSIPHTNTGPAPMGSPARPQLSLVPERPELDMPLRRQPTDDQWQERALCAQTDPEAFFPEKGGSTREAKRICRAARFAMRASITRWPMTSASASGVASPSGSAVASSAASSSSAALLVVDRRVDDRGLDAQIGGHLGHKNLMQKLGEFDGVLRPSLDRLAEQHNSRASGIPANVDPRRDQPGQRDRTVGHHLRRPLHTIRVLAATFAVSRRRRRRACSPGPATAARSARRPRAPPCRTARLGCASRERWRKQWAAHVAARRVVRSLGHPRTVTVGRSALPTAACPDASPGLSRDSLSFVNVPRRCCRPGCPHYAVATLTFVYSDSTAVVGPLATVSEPHSWDLCVSHAGRITAPRGWELVRHAGPLPSHPDEDDLIALAEAVREGREVPRGGFAAGFTDPVTGAYGGALMALARPTARVERAAGAATCGCCPTPRTSRNSLRRYG